MSTTPVVPSPSSTVAIEATVTKDITWIKAHALICLLAIALIAGSIIGGITLFEGLIERHDERVAATAQKAEGVDTAAQAALVAQLAQYRAEDTVRDAAQNTLIASLVSQMSQQHAATNKQVATDATLDAQAAGARLSGQTKAGPGDVTVVGDNITMSLPLTRIVVTDLDLLPQAQSDVTNLQGQLSAQQILTTDAKTELGTANGIIAADKVELLATVKGDNAACQVRVDKQADKDRKRGIWATIGGVIVGIVFRSAI